MAATEVRLTKELTEVSKDDGTSGVTADVVGGRGANNRHLRGKIKGPMGTPYEGGVFEIDIVIPPQYPFEPPKMKFMTKIWHPNISSQTGAICLVRKMDVCRSVHVPRRYCEYKHRYLNLSAITYPSHKQDILKDQWSPALTIKTALLSLQALLCSPEPGDPQDAEVAKMYKKNFPTFEKTAKFWTEMYASEKSKDDAIARVCEMGFDRQSAKKALEKHSWDESAAVNELLGAF